MTTTAREPDLAARLAAPFDPREIRWKAQSVKNNRALAVPYISARTVMDRLDEVVGPENWQTEYVPLADGSVQCRLSLRVGGNWVAKTDVGSPSEQPDEGDRTKASFSDAIKRAAVQWGVGRYLYRLPSVWCDFDPVKKQLAQTPQLPAWALPAGAKPTPAPKPAPAAGPQPGPVEQIKALFRESGGSTGSDWYAWWEPLMAWLNSAYPEATAKYTRQTLPQDIEPARLGHLIRRINSLAVQKAR